MRMQASCLPVVHRGPAMLFNSIRWRIQAWHALLLVILLASFGWTAYQFTREQHLRRIDQELQQRLGLLSRVLRPNPAPFLRSPSGLSQTNAPRLSPNGPPFNRPPLGRLRPPPRPDLTTIREQMLEALQQAPASNAGQSNAFYFVFWREGSGLVRSPTAPDDPPKPAAGRTTPFTPGLTTNSSRGPAPRRPAPMIPPVSRTRGEWREIYRFDPNGDCLLVGRSMAPDLAEMQWLALCFIAAGLGVLGLGLAVGWWLASRAIRPIEDISATAAKIVAGDLSHRINAADTDSELGCLAGVLNSTFARLEAAFAHQARFTSDASHELRTPVSVILAQTQTALSRERAAGEYREALEACQRAAQRMRKLTESLLELARLDAGQEPVKLHPFDLSGVARDCIELVSPLAAERGIAIHSELPPIPCLGDAELFGQVATNLLTNAIQNNRPNGQVRVSAHAENGSVLFSVADTGVGIPAADLPHIFERFYRVDKIRSYVPGRTGLGLAICKAIIDAHSGAIEVTSQPGEGATFKVKLPLK